MKKIFTFLAIGIASIGATVAQFNATSGGPDAFGYSWVSSDDSSATPNPNKPTYNWIDISSRPGVVDLPVNSQTFPDDGVNGPFEIGFEFPYYWYSETMFSIGSNGYISFGGTPLNIASGTTSGSDAFPSLPSLDYDDNGVFLGYDNILAPMLADLWPRANPTDTTASTKIMYYTNNSDSLIVTYENIPFWWDEVNNVSIDKGFNTFQVIITKVNSSITFQYKRQNGDWSNAYDLNGGTNQMIIGIESRAGQAGLTVNKDTVVNQVFKPTENLAIKFSLNKNPDFTLIDVSLNSNQNAANGAIFGMVERPTWINVNLSNDGDSDINSDMNVKTTIIGSYDGVQTTANIFGTPGFTLTSLAKGESVDYTYVNALYPENQSGKGEPGTYTILSTLDFLSDGVPANNNVKTELVILDNTDKKNLKLNYYDTLANLNSNLGTINFASGSTGGVYIDLPFYPVIVKKIQIYLWEGVNAPNGSLTLRIHARNADGSVGEELMSEELIPVEELFLNPRNIAPGNPVLPYEFELPEYITIEDKGFYISYELDAANYFVLEDGAAPFSLRTFEIQAGSWIPSRSAASGDIMLGAIVDGDWAWIGINEPLVQDKFEITNAYPNPSSGLTSIDVVLNEKATVSFELSNVIGQKVENKQFGNLNKGKHQINFDVSKLESGVYFYTLSIDSEKFTKKLIVK